MEAYYSLWVFCEDSRGSNNLSDHLLFFTGWSSKKLDGKQEVLLQISTPTWNMGNPSGSLNCCTSILTLNTEPLIWKADLQIKRDRYKEKQIFYLVVHFPNVSNNQGWTGWSQESEPCLGLPHTWQWLKYLEPCSVGFSLTYQGSEVKQAGLQLALLWDCWWQSNSLCQLWCKTLVS